MLEDHIFYLDQLGNLDCNRNDEALFAGMSVFENRVCFVFFIRSNSNNNAIYQDMTKWFYRLLLLL